LRFTYFSNPFTLGVAHVCHARGPQHTCKLVNLGYARKGDWHAPTFICIFL
jgi:hypothetical protein